MQASLADAQDEDRLKRAVNTVPTHAELNAMLARSEQERLIFDHLDRTLTWPEPAGVVRLPSQHLPSRRCRPSVGLEESCIDHLSLRGQHPAGLIHVHGSVNKDGD